MKLIICFFTLVFSISAFAWNSVGHRIIAQIAYDQLTPAAKKQVDKLTAIQFHSRYPEARFARASTWPDQIKQKTTRYNAWHYVDIPLVKDGIKPPMLNPENVEWSIARAEKIVSDKTQSNQRRAKYLSFLIHFVGDISQPLHCTTLYSAQFPTGDKGGNLYLIHSSIADNLHQLWDRGVGLFVSSPDHYQFHYYDIEKIATAWMNQYPVIAFTNRLQEALPSQWAADSHQIAVSFAYTIPVDGTPSAHYIQRAQLIVKQQIVLAGDRLANILNHIFI